MVSILKNPQLVLLNIEKIKSFKSNRRFLAADFNMDNWESLAPYIERLLNEEILSSNDFKEWLLKWSELEGVISEDVAWRYINMTIDTSNKSFAEKYSNFVENISPFLQKEGHKINEKIASCPFIDQENPTAFEVYKRGIITAIELFNEENIALKTKEQLLEKEYGEIAGKMSIEYDGKELTMPIAATYLKNTNRQIRQTVWETMSERRLNDAKKLDCLLSDMINLRHQIAINTGFKNYRDYKFKALNRFDYTPKDCFNFHKSCKEHVIPLVQPLLEYRKNKLELDTLKPWDLSIDIEGKKALKVYQKEDEFIEKGIACFNEIDPYFGECLNTMKELGYLDLFSRKNKAPGGYNYPLNEIGIPFIFMNAAGTVGDLTTLVHEGGHAIHSFITRSMPMVAYRSAPMEVSEVASMAMELISMDYWHHFFPNIIDLKRAKVYQLERVISVLPWIAQVDEFQHFLYENPKHSHIERKEYWDKLNKEYSSGLIDQNENKKYSPYTWQKQLHIFEVPFYYIEYGIAQLGAIGLWMQFKKDKNKGISNYKKMLSLGNTRTIPELYKAAELEFDFSSKSIRSLCQFVESEIQELLD